MGAVESIVLGIIQGLTEFFPISSSAHLLLFRALMPLGEPSLLFDVLLHAGTWLAVLFVFLPSVGRILKHPGIVVKVLLATVPAGLFGYLFENGVEEIFRKNLLLVSAILLGMGVVFLFVRKEGKETLEEMGFGDALLIGLLQALALLPGISRSGITILGGIGIGLRRAEAVLFSFLLSLTTIAGAVLLVLLRHPVYETVPLEAASLGFLASLLSGVVACVFLLKLVREKGLAPFGYYRIAAGGFFLLFLLLR
ncbi:MAG: undecaprenyl-diphosphate phosphatase [Candidatus Caldatribacteriaceae bacterium]